VAEILSEIRVGLLAYGAIGDQHNRAVSETEGLKLTAVADTNPERLIAAIKLAPGIITFSDSTEMLDSGLIDLVIISTPPNSHYSWAKESLNRGLHVILEKPMALTVEQCDELIAIATAKKLLLVVYQNRRYDADFVTMKKLIDDGAIGEIFSYESFVGGYSKPCSYWHSDLEVSGGAIFDWGSHFIDQILAMIPAKVDAVSGINQKRLWNHVTNADHADVSITFSGGARATFTNSDLAAARKPKFYVLGTTGAIVGNWDPAAGSTPADLPAILTVHHADGASEVISNLPVNPFSFHQSVVAYLKHKIPMNISTQQSRDVVAIMQAAEESALANGHPVKPVLIR
jgi:scyllo-inositol 2-dehydrogenase (NADP+)|tara:strand:- start:5093 stop:6124 length:1032 start_codon:yes stop_codon:yes gene_type:complete